ISKNVLYINFCSLHLRNIYEKQFFIFKQHFNIYILLKPKMKFINLLLLSLLVTVFGSCVNNEDVQLETYPEKEVILNTKTLITTSDIPFARIQADPVFPDYTHSLPTQFNV